MEPRIAVSVSCPELVSPLIRNLTFGVKGVSLRGGEIGWDVEGAGVGRLGVGEVRDSSGDGVVDEGGRIGADSSVHNVQIAGGVAVLADVGALYAGQYRLAVIGVDQLAGAVEVGVQRAGAVLDGHRQRRRRRRRTGLGVLVEGET